MAAKKKLTNFAVSFQRNNIPADSTISEPIFPVMKKLTMLVVMALLLVMFPDMKLMSGKYQSDDDYEKQPGNYDIENGLRLSDAENFDIAIEFIKAHEGYAGGNKYYCVSGNLTIGYGHVIMEGEEFPDHITMEQADSLLRSDFGKSLKLANMYLPNMRGSRKAAVTHFIFSKGIGAFLRSGLYREINANGDVDSEFVKWCYFISPSTGNKIYSSTAAKIQDWEKDMWHKDDKYYAKAGLLKNNRF